MFNFAQKELAPYAQAIDKDNGWVKLREFWKKMGDMGFLGITASSKYGGSDGSYFAHMLIVEEIARASVSISTSYAVHSNVCIDNINRY